MAYPQKYLGEQKLLAEYLMQHAPIDDVSAFLSKYICPTNAEKTLEIKKPTLNGMRSKTRDKTIDPVKLGNALGLLKISKEDVEGFLGKPMFEPEPVPEQKSNLSSSEKEGEKEVVKGEHNDGVEPSQTEREQELEERLRAAQRKVTELEGGKKEAARVEEKVPEESVSKPELEPRRVTAEDLIYYKGRAGLEDLKKEKLIEELRDIPGVKAEIIKIIIKRWDSDPRVRNELGLLYELLRRWIPKQLSNEVLRDVTDVIGQVEIKYRDLVDQRPEPIYIPPQRQEPQQPPIFEQLYNPQSETRRGETKFTPLAPQDQRGRQTEQRDPRNPNVRREATNFDERLYNDIQYLMRRNNELEAKLEDAKTHPVGNSAQANFPAKASTTSASQSIAGSQQPLQPAVQPPPQPFPTPESLQQSERLRDMEKRLEERDKELENVKETNRQREAELNELRTMRRNQDLLDKMSMQIDQKLGSYTSEVDRQIDDIAGKIEGMKSDLPKGMTAEDIVKLRQVTDPYALETQKIDLQRQREERADARKATMGENIGKFVDSIGGKVTQAALKTTGLVEEETGVEHQVQSATPYEKTPELMVFPCPICGNNINAGATTTRVQCPSCKMWFNKVPDGQAVFIPEQQPQQQQPERVDTGGEADVKPVNMSQKLHTQFGSEQVGAAERGSEGEENKVEAAVEAEEKGIAEVKGKGKGKGKGETQKEEEEGDGEE